jgi:hypothetical protein
VNDENENVKKWLKSECEINKGTGVGLF